MKVNQLQKTASYLYPADEGQRKQHLQQTGNSGAAEKQQGDSIVISGEGRRASEVQTGQARKSGAGSAAEYYSYLKKSYDCVRNGSVAISGAYLKECAKNPEKAKELEENLSFFKESYENGLKSAQVNARAIGARVVSHSESWSIDGKGNITMTASTTVTSESGGKGWKELLKERREKLKEKLAAKRKREEQLAIQRLKRKKEKEVLQVEALRSKKQRAARIDLKV